MKKLIILSLLLMGCKKKQEVPAPEPEPTPIIVPAQPTLCVAATPTFVGKYVAINVQRYDTVRIGLVSNGCPSDGNLNTYTMTGMSDHIRPLVTDTISNPFSVATYTFVADESKDYVGLKDNNSSFTIFEPKSNGVIEVSVVAKMKVSGNLLFVRVK